MTEEESQKDTATLSSETTADETEKTEEKHSTPSWYERFLMRVVVAKVLKKPLSAIRPKKSGESSAKTPKTVTNSEKPSLMKRHLAWEFRNAYIFAPFLIVFFLPRFMGEGYGEYFLHHLGLAVIVLIPFAQVAAYTVRNYSRTHPPRSKSGRPKRPAQPPLPKTSRYVRDITDIMGNLDHFAWRLFYALGFIAIVVTSGIVAPLRFDTFTNLNGPGQQEAIREIIMGLAIPVFYYAVSIYRTQSVINARQYAVDAVYAIARDTLKYPKANARVTTKNAARLKNPHEAIDVKKWRALYEIDECFVLAPEELSVEEVKPWDEFSANMNAKLPRTEEWRIQRDPKGRGATAGPANYPTGVLWDGEYDPDPLTFIIGQNLETGKKQYLTLSEVSPHVAVSGATSSGKDLGLSTLVKTPHGDRQAGDLEVGDEVFDERGQVVVVTALSDIRIPSTAYRVTFNDGTAVDVSDTHPWTTWDRSARVAAGRQRKRVRSNFSRKTWLTEGQRAILAAELDLTQEGDDITVKDVIRLVGGETMLDRPFYEIARAIGVCRTRQRITTFKYADQVVNQKQTCTVIDRSEASTVREHLARSTSKRMRDAAIAVDELSKGEGELLAMPEISQATGMDSASLSAVLRRSGVRSLRKEKVAVSLVVPGKEVTRGGTVTDEFYPKRPFLEALLERGLRESNDQHHLMSMPKVRTTAEIAGTLRYRPAGASDDAASWANHSIPRAGAAQFPARALSVDPYVLGAWLGDGTASNGGFTSIDSPIWEEIEQAGYKVTHHPRHTQSHRINNLVPSLRDLGVLNNKHIPDDYQHASVDQRLALLQGLMDTDGSVNKVSGTCEFYASNEAFARQVRSLVASLGMIAHLRSRPGGYRDADGALVECKEAWTVAFSPTMQVFRLPRKASLIDPEAECTKSEHRYIVSVEEIAPEPMRCIMVNSDTHQFLVTDQYVPTHNTSLAEIMAAQVLVKPMPWDSNLYGMVVIVDPKGPFARRWGGRPGVVAINGQEDAAEPDDDGSPITGPVVMASGMEWLEVEHKRRANILARYKDLSSWVDMPDDVKRSEKFFPILVILDEYLDHTDIEEENGDERVEKENFARKVTTRMANWHARKYRNVGMHTVLIAQEVKMTAIGSALMRNLPVRAITGQMDSSQLRTMFGDRDDIPSLPSTRYVFTDGEKKAKTIPGRARFMNTLGQDIEKVQISWFGGKTNSETLDKWLPRNEAPPNGDFSLPGGKPRKASDFDDEGNYIGEDGTAPQDATSDLPDDPADAGTATTDEAGDDTPAGLEDDEQFPDEWDGGTTPSTASAGDDVFPAAEADDFPDSAQETPKCTHEGCSNDVKADCTKCGNPTCADHLERLASQKATERFCPTCRATHPLVKAGVEEIYGVMEKEVRPMKGFKSAFQVRDDGAVSAIITIPTGQKLIEVRGVPGQEPASRSRSSQHSGTDDVIEHVRDALNGYKRG